MTWSHVVTKSRDPRIPFWRSWFRDSNSSSRYFAATLGSHEIGHWFVTPTLMPISLTPTPTHIFPSFSQSFNWLCLTFTWLAWLGHSINFFQFFSLSCTQTSLTNTWLCLLQSTCLIWSCSEESHSWLKLDFPFFTEYDHWLDLCMIYSHMTHTLISDSYVVVY